MCSSTSPTSGRPSASSPACCDRAGGRSSWSPSTTPARRPFEDPSISSPAARERAYRQLDHLRLYGADVAARLSGPGLMFTAEAYATELGPRLVERHRLLEVDEIYVGRRAESAAGHDSP